MNEIKMKNSPEEMAEKLIDMFYRNIDTAFMPKTYESARRCAIICCEQAKLAASTTLVLVDKQKENQGIDDIVDTDYILHDCAIPYWDAVIEQIQINGGYRVTIKYLQTQEQNNCLCNGYCKGLNETKPENCTS